MRVTFSARACGVSASTSVWAEAGSARVRTAVWRARRLPRVQGGARTQGYSLRGRPNSRMGPPGQGAGRDATVSRWSPAHHRVSQGPCPCRRGRRRARGGRHGGQRADLTMAQQRADPGGDRDHDAPHGADNARGGRQGDVGPVQQPGHRERGQNVDGGHHGRGVMPGVPVAHGHGHLTAHAMSGVAGLDDPGEVRVACDLQCQMQRGLRGEGASERGRERGAPPDDGPDHDELCTRHQHHEPPGHRSVDDGVMPQGGDHRTGQGENACPDPGRSAARVGPTAAVGEGHHHVVPNDRPSLRPGRPLPAVRHTPCQRASAACHTSAPPRSQGGYGSVISHVHHIAKVLHHAKTSGRPGRILPTRA